MISCFLKTLNTSQNQKQTIEMINMIVEKLTLRGSILKGNPISQPQLGQPLIFSQTDIRLNNVITFFPYYRMILRSLTLRGGEQFMTYV